MNIYVADKPWSLYAVHFEIRFTHHYTATDFNSNEEHWLFIDLKTNKYMYD